MLGGVTSPNLTWAASDEFVHTLGQNGASTQQLNPRPRIDRDTRHEHLVSAKGRLIES
jgi:hypothetical protein